MGSCAINARTIVMAKTILIPTDLHVGSLSALKAAIGTTGSEQLNVILMHAEHLPDGITDLLFHSPRRELRRRMGSAFTEALAVLRNHHERRLVGICVEPFNGGTAKAFDQFLRARGVDEIHVSGSYKLRRGSRSLDPMPLIRAASAPLVIHGGSQAVVPGDAATVVDHLQFLFDR